MEITISVVTLVGLVRKVFERADVARTSNVQMQRCMIKIESTADVNLLNLIDCNIFSGSQRVCFVSTFSIAAPRCLPRSGSLACVAPSSFSFALGRAGLAVIAFADRPRFWRFVLCCCCWMRLLMAICDCFPSNNQNHSNRATANFFGI